MNTTWKYLVIQFLSVTNGNYKKAVKLSNYHDAALRAKAAQDPLLIPIYNRYHVLHLLLIKEYNLWKSAGGIQEGHTLNVEQMLTIAYSNMPLWDITIQGTGVDFMAGTPNYLSIFNDGKKPFMNGSIDGRINAYDTLAKNMVPFVPLASIMGEVETVFDTLDEARDVQLGAKSNLKTSSNNVEEARIKAMTMQWRNLGFCMDVYWENLPFIESLFDLETLREGRQVIFTGALAPAENKAVLTRTFTVTEQLRLNNNGNAEIFLYLGTSPNGIESDAIKLIANEERTLLASEFGALDFSKHRFLTAVNQNPDRATQYEVELL